MTIYITLPNGDILDRYDPPRFVRFALRFMAAIRRAWRAFRSEPSLGRLKLARPEAVPARGASQCEGDLTSALVNLGMKKRDASILAVEVVRRHPGYEFDGLLRAALAERRAA